MANGVLEWWSIGVMDLKEKGILLIFSSITPLLHERLKIP